MVRHHGGRRSPDDRFPRHSPTPFDKKNRSPDYSEPHHHDKKNRSPDRTETHHHDKRNRSPDRFEPNPTPRTHSPDRFKPLVVSKPKSDAYLKQSVLVGSAANAVKTARPAVSAGYHIFNASKDSEKPEKPEVEVGYQILPKAGYQISTSVIGPAMAANKKSIHAYDNAMAPQNKVTVPAKKTQRPKMVKSIRTASTAKVEPCADNTINTRSELAFDSGLQGSGLTTIQTTGKESPKGKGRTSVKRRSKFRTYVSQHRYVFMTCTIIVAMIVIAAVTGIIVHSVLKKEQDSTTASPTKSKHNERMF